MLRANNAEGGSPIRRRAAFFIFARTTDFSNQCENSSTRWIGAAHPIARVQVGEQPNDFVVSAPVQGRYQSDH
jgi:hypothetical protein